MSSESQNSKPNQVQAPAMIEQRSLVIFRLGEQVYAIPIDIIIQILEMVTITPIPQVNSVVEGAINVRGEAVPVINLREYLGLPRHELQVRTPIILTQINPPGWGDVRQKVGLIVDEVIDVMGTLDDHVTSLPKILPEALRNAPIVQGLVHTLYGMVIFLDLHQLFSPRRGQGVAVEADMPVLNGPIQALPKPAELNRLLVEVDG